MIFIGFRVTKQSKSEERCERVALVITVERFGGVERFALTIGEGNALVVPNRDKSVADTLSKLDRELIDGFAKEILVFFEDAVDFVYWFGAIDVKDKVDRSRRIT